MSRDINVEDLVDEQKIGKFNLRLLFWLFLVMLLDGFDITAAAFAAPELVKAWGIPRSALGPLLSASLFGILVGSLAFGYIGDRYGRKTGTIISCFMFGLFSLMAVWATSLNELTILRALAGIGIGGIFPNAVALSAEYAPKRLRATMIILMFTGNTFGAALPGVISVWLVPQYGWQVLFLIGGIIPIVLAVCLCFVLPESIKFLALNERHKERTIQMLRRLKPDFVFNENDRFVTHEAVGSKFRISQLFEGKFALATPLLWLVFALNLMVFYFINSWMPTLVAAADVPASRGAIALMMFQLGGTCGGLALSRMVDRFGLKPIYGMFLIAVPVVASIGYLATSSPVLLMFAAFLAGFCVLGVQFGLNATPGMIYPTSCRANGAGFAFGVGRLGAVLGPLLGGLLISLQLPIQKLYIAAAAPMVIGAFACFILARTLKR
jgi:AAHS family 4-hydroxybenzoate transporter-like MFS transporter